MKLAGIIVAYNPDILQFVSNIERVISDVDQLLIFKNSQIEIESNLLEKYGDKIVFLGTENNVGIAEALNAGIHWSKENNFTHILALDQDSYFQEGHLFQFKKLIEIGIEIKDVGVYIPNFINKGNIHITKATTPFEVPDGITSGSIIPVSLFDMVGGFNNFLFIDGVDNEFCYRIKKNHGMKTVMFPIVHLFHELGQHKKTLFGFSTLNYSAFRTFYLVRNHILLLRKYPNYYTKEDKIIILKDFIFYRLIKVLLAEKDKRRKITAIAKGVFHGLKCKLTYL